MPEVPYEPDEHGWFRVSRKLVHSSRWFNGTPDAVKLMIFLLERASDPMNAWPGDVFMVGAPLAAGAAIPQKACDKAVMELMGEDPDSQSQKKRGAFIEPLTRKGRVVGYRIINFFDYNPDALDRSYAKQRERAHARAVKASAARWNLMCDTPGCEFRPEARIGDKRYCHTHAVAARATEIDDDEDEDDGDGATFGRVVVAKEDDK